MRALDPEREVASWSRVGRWWRRRLAQDLLDVNLLGLLPPSRRVRTVLLLDATDPDRHLRPPEHLGPSFNASAWRLLSTRWTRAEELAHLCVRGWRLEYSGTDVVKHPKFQEWMLVPVALRHVVEWGTYHRYDLPEGLLQDGTRERAVLDHVTSHLQRQRTPQEERRKVGDQAIQVALLLLHLPEPEWEVYTQLAEDTPWSDRDEPWERLEELTQAARNVLA